MRTTFLPSGVRGWLVAAVAAGVLVALGLSGGDARVAAGPINPKAYQMKFDKAREKAEVVASVRVLAAVCTERTGEGKKGVATLELALQVLTVEKGPVKKNDVLLVAYKVNLPAGPGPGMYGYWGALQQCPCTAGAQGDVALRWDKEARRYALLAGWVPSPNKTLGAVPSEVGKAYVAGDGPAPK
jgi:hypothetical protein